MTATSDNQHMPISQVGLSAWSLAQRAATASVIGDRIVQRMAGMPQPGSWPSIVSRYTLAAAHAPTAEFTLLQRLAVVDRVVDSEQAGAWFGHADLPRRLAARPREALQAAATVVTPAGAPGAARFGRHGPAPAGAPAIQLTAGQVQREFQQLHPAAHSANTALPGTVGVRPAPLTLLLAPPTALLAASPHAAVSTPIPPNGALQRQVAVPIAPAGRTRTAVVDGVQPGQNFDQDDQGDQGDQGDQSDQEMASAPETISVPARASSPVQHTAGIHTAPDALPQPPMLAPILRRAVLAAGAQPAKPTLLARMAEASSSQPFAHTHEVTSVEQHADQAEQAPVSAVPWPPQQMPTMQVAREPGMRAESAMAGEPIVRQVTAASQPATPARSSLQRILEAERHGTFAAPLLMRSSGKPPGTLAQFEPNHDHGTLPRGEQLAGNRRPDAQQRSQSSESATLVQRRPALEAREPYDSQGNTHGRSTAEQGPEAPAMPQQRVLRAATAQPASEQMDAYTPPAHATTPSVVARSAIVAPPIQRSAQPGRVAGEPLAPANDAELNWDSLPLVSRAVQRSSAAASNHTGRMAHVGHVARAAEQWGAGKQALFSEAPQAAAQPEYGQLDTPPGPGLPPVASVRPPEVSSPTPTGNRVPYAADAPPGPTGDRAAGKESAAQRTHTHTTAGVPSPAPLLRAVLPALEDRPDHSAAAPAVQRHAVHTSTAAPDGGERWRVPAPTPSTQVQRAATLDMLRPLAGAIQREGDTAMPGQPAIEESMSAQLNRDSAGSAASALSSVEHLDIEALAQKVYDYIRRQMRIDRERLGR